MANPRRRSCRKGTGHPPAAPDSPAHPRVLYCSRPLNLDALNYNIRHRRVPGLAGRIPGVRRLPGAFGPTLDDAVLFNSWNGRYSDNPRAIGEELRRVSSGLRQVWVSAGRDEFPIADATVPPWSRRYLTHLRRARYVVSNLHFLPEFVHKRPDTVYVQTWHGTPLKRIDFDIVNPTFPNADEYFRLVKRDIAAWDYLISPNAFSTEIFRQAFRYDGEIVESGYPRNDVLKSPQAGAIRSEVRTQLRIAGDQRAVLYAPTWRDDETFSVKLDVERLASHFAGSHVILVRAHHNAAREFRDAENEHVRNVSGHSDIRELYLAADALLTDYSSTMFDFAVTGRPVLLYTYDLARYRDVTRGLYFDLAEEAPGPLLSDLTEVIWALENLDEVRRSHEDAYRRFVERFCHLDDGRAASRVIDAVLGPHARPR